MDEIQADFGPKIGAIGKRIDAITERWEKEAYERQAAGERNAAVDEPAMWREVNESGLLVEQTRLQQNADKRSNDCARAFLEAVSSQLPDSHRALATNVVNRAMVDVAFGRERNTLDFSIPFAVLDAIVEAADKDGVVERAFRIRPCKGAGRASVEPLSELAASALTKAIELSNSAISARLELLSSFNTLDQAKAFEDPSGASAKSLGAAWSSRLRMEFEETNQAIDAIADAIRASADTAIAARWTDMAWSSIAPRMAQRWWAEDHLLPEIDRMQVSGEVRAKVQGLIRAFQAEQRDTRIEAIRMSAPIYADLIEADYSNGVGRRRMEPVIRTLERGDQRQRALLAEVQALIAPDSTSLTKLAEQSPTPAGFELAKRFREMFREK